MGSVAPSEEPYIVEIYIYIYTEYFIVQVIDFFLLE